MSQPPTVRTGGCQCGAIRYRVEGELMHPGICHCRMCQKATGGFFAAFVTARRRDFSWTRGYPKHFQSSNKVRRGFCDACGTQLTFEGDWEAIDLTIGSFDDPRDLRPISQIGVADKLPYTDDIPHVPHRSAEAQAKMDAWFARVVSNQHPDHDT
jgi:hypothetical protein